MHRRTRQIWRALGALLVLVITVVGVPVALVAFVGWPLPTTVPTLEELSRVLSRGDVSTPGLIKALSVAVWLAWLQLAIATLSEAIGVARGHRARRVPGPRPLRMAAAHLVTTAALLLSSPVRPALAADHETPTLAAILDQGTDPSEMPTATPSVAAITHDDDTDERASLTDGDFWVVRPRDTLWDIAERTLGDGLRWQDIQRLNIGRPQPDGRALQPDDDFIAPGWQLRLPGDATLHDEAASDAESIDDVDATASAPFITVDPGDSLWDLSEQHLGDPMLWPYLYATNQNRLQPDGRRLSDPDLIHPGWRLELPLSDARPTSAPPQQPRTEDGEGSSASDWAGVQDDVPGTGERSSAQATGSAKDEPTQRAPSEVRSDPQANDGSSASETAVPWRQLITVAGAGLIAAGIAATLDRIRRAQRRRRPVGRHISLPEGHSAKIELGIRGLADQKTARDVQQAIDAVRAQPQDLEDPATRRIVLVSTSSRELAVHLARPDHEPPHGWQVTDNGHTWRTAVGDDQRTGPGLGDGPSLFVTLGTTAEGRRRVQINLAHAGVLGIDCGPERQGATLLGFAVELATAMTVCHPQVVCVGFGRDLDALEWIETAGDPAEVIAALEQRADDIQDRPAVDLPDIQPIVALFDAPPDPPLLDRLQTVVDRGRGGLAAVVAGTEQLTWSLRMAAGRWRLSPVDVEMTPIELDGDELQHVGELVRMAKNPFYVPPREDGPATVPGRTVESPDDDESVGPSISTNEDVHAHGSADHDNADGPVDDGRSDDPADASGPGPTVKPHGDQDGTDAPSSQGADASPETAEDKADQGAEPEGHPEVKILGVVQVKGTGDDWPTSKSKEAVIYLATRRDGVDGDTLMEALWPREAPNRNRLQTEISRARSVLGEAPDGQPYLPPPKNSIYRLDDRVQTDLERFRQFVRDAAARPDDVIDLLQAALDLVDERPWSGVPKGCYSWASFQTHAVEQSVADAAHKLAQLYLDEGRPSRAISAARIGLMADDHYEALYRDLMEAAAATGNTMEVQRIMQDLRQRLVEETGANDADDWMDPETVQLYDKLTAGRTTTTR